MAFATSSHTACLREEITTLAPCSAIRSAMARPMPREDPVMTATFPDISNKVMLHSLYPWSGGMHRFALGQLAGGCDLRSRRLVHCVMRRVGDPWLLIDHRHPPAAMRSTCEVVEPGHRTII